MNGATAELWANSISPPKSAMTRKTGNSQNFLRTRRKAQNSRRKPSIRSSELVPECFGCGAGRFAHDPVALRRWLEFPPRILASEPHQQGDGGDAAGEQDAGKTTNTSRFARARGSAHRETGSSTQKRYRSSALRRAGRSLPDPGTRARQKIDL